MDAAVSRTAQLEGYDDLSVFVGDIHNHCGISYGHGSIEDAYANAQLQLDFASVTGHAWWHDMPYDDPESADAIAFHTQGFERLDDCWDHVQDVTAAAHEDGRFVSLLSFEWHSLTHGDRCVYFNGPRGDLIRADDLDHLHAELRALRNRGVATMALPHHIGYHRGYRGINWATYTAEFAPVVEMMSMHGCGEASDAPRPYLHRMGPRDAESMAVHGLRLGHRFGLIGSTDHHSAHPGSFGHGRVAAWSTELTRDGIWDALWRRRVYAVTGDPIVVATRLNEAIMGEVAHPAHQRRIQAEVRSCAAIDYLELVRNGRPVHRVSRHQLTPAGLGETFSGVLGFTVGWGKQGEPAHWDVQLLVEEGHLVHVQPRLRGEDILAPADSEPVTCQFSSWGQDGEHTVWLRTITQGNATTVTDGTQGLSLWVEGTTRTRLIASVNGHKTSYTVGELLDGPRAGYLGGFRSPAFQFERATGAGELTATLEFEEERLTSDWYYVRVRQTNDQWAWTSPIWIDTPAAAL